MRLHHIGYLVKKIDKSMKAFQALGYSPVSLCGGNDVMYDEGRKCDIAFMQQADAKGMYIELISPKNEDSPIWGLMSTYKNTPYHLCFISENLDSDIQDLRETGWTVFQPASCAPAIGNSVVVFLVHRSAGIIELVATVEYEEK